MYQYSKFYYSSKLFGNDKIIKKFYNLTSKKSVPITIPHGINFYQHNSYIHDFYSFEPYYASLREDIHRDVVKKKRVSIKMPHPWLMYLKIKKKTTTKIGTLFITGSPSLEIYERFYNNINFKNLPKPYFCLIKERSAKKKHFNWWLEKNIKPLSAGKMTDQDFYKNLYKIFNNCSDIVIFDMTSAAIFAATLEKKIHIVPNVFTYDIDMEVVKIPKLNSYNYKKVKKIWKIFASNKIKESKKMALFLLGNKFFKNSKTIKSLLEKDIKIRPLYLGGINNSLLYSIILKLIHYNNFFIKFFPFPLKKIINKIKQVLKLEKVYITKFNSFGYYKIKGIFRKPQTLNLYQYQLQNFEPGEHARIKKKYKHLYNI